LERNGVTNGGGTITVASGDTLVMFGTISEGTGSNAAAQLTMAGPGTLALFVPATYTGGTVISGGTLQLEANSVLPSSGGVNIGSSATLAVNNGERRGLVR
jgi:autotransporter-associated beta strand protein